MNKINILNNLKQGLHHPQYFQNLLVGMLYFKAYQLPWKFYLEEIPDWFIDTYIRYLLESPQLFTRKGETEEYYQYYQTLVNYLHEKIFANPDSQLWQYIAIYFTYNSNFIPCYFNYFNVKDLYVKRARIIQFALEIQGSQIDYSFSTRLNKNGKIKLGILAAHYNPQTETFANLPFYKYLNRDKFEIILLSHTQSNHRLERYCVGHSDRYIILQGNIQEQVEFIRQIDCDILFTATNVTANSNKITLLSAHRLAPIQVTSVSSCVTTGMPSIDYYISGKLAEKFDEAQEQYSENLIVLDGPAHCYDFGTEDCLTSTIEFDRASFGISEDEIIYISGANFFKITPELESIWAQIISSVPNSKLVLYPFNPNWSNNYPIQIFKERIKKTFIQNNLSEDRLIILDPLVNSIDAQKRLQIGDIYLDSFPFSSVTSLLDPLKIGMPVVLKDGNSFRSLMGVAFLKELNILDLISQDDRHYLELAISLGKNLQKRKQISEQIKISMKMNPCFLDSKQYSKKIENIFVNIFNKYQNQVLIKEFNLTNINYIIFPDWSINEEQLAIALTNLIKKLATISLENEDIITLIMDTTGISEEDVNLILSGIAMNLMWEEELDIENTFNVVLISNYASEQWQDLRPKVTAKISLDHDNIEVIQQANIDEDIVSINGNGNNYVIFPDWKTSPEELSVAISDVLTQVANFDEENKTLLVDVSDADSEEVGLFFSEVAMNLMLVEGIELDETIHLSFVNLTSYQWQSLQNLIKQKIDLPCESLPEQLPDFMG